MLHIIPSIVERKRLEKHVPAAMNTQATIQEILNASLPCTARDLSQESLCICLFIPLSLLGDNLLNMCPGNEELLEESFSSRSVSH